MPCSLCAQKPGTVLLRPGAYVGHTTKEAPKRLNIGAFKYGA